jgi:hypothetical protein
VLPDAVDVLINAEVKPKLGPAMIGESIEGALVGFELAKGFNFSP